MMNNTTTEETEEVVRVHSVDDLQSINQGLLREYHRIIVPASGLDQKLKTDKVQTLLLPNITNIRIAQNLLHK